MAVGGTGVLVAGSGVALGGTGVLVSVGPGVFVTVLVGVAVDGATSGWSGWPAINSTPSSHMSTGAGPITLRESVTSASFAGNWNVNS